MEPFLSRVRKHLSVATTKDVIIAICLPLATFYIVAQEHVTKVTARDKVHAIVRFKTPVSDNNGKLLLYLDDAATNWVFENAGNRTAVVLEAGLYVGNRALGNPDKCIVNGGRVSGIAKPIDIEPGKPRLESFAIDNAVWSPSGTSRLPNNKYLCFRYELSTQNGNTVRAQIVLGRVLSEITAKLEQPIVLVDR